MLVLYLLLAVVILCAAKYYFQGPEYTGPWPELGGRVAVITGGNGGIGGEVVRALARRGCRVIIGARDMGKSRLLAESIRAEGGTVDYLHLDLSDLGSVRQFAREVKDSTGQVDYLINNAGIMGVATRTLTPHGHQLHYAVNHLGHFYLCHLLLPLLVRSPHFRIINVSSISHARLYGFLQPVRLQPWDPHFHSTPYSPPKAYSLSKLYNILFTRALAQRIEGGLALSLHPGVVRTEIMAGFRRGWLGVLYKLLEPLFVLVSKNARQGAQTVVKLVCDREEKLVNGGYYKDCALAAESGEVNKANWDRLWECSQRDLGIVFGKYQ